MTGRIAAHDIFEGVRVIDAAGYIAGTGGGVLLAGLGAEVIKIEDPVRGDAYRGMAKQYGESTSVKGRHIGFETANLNKKSMTLNLNKVEGREVLHQLLARSDIFHTNFLQKTRDKLRLNYDDLKVSNPRLVYCVTSGFGSRGPLAKKRAYDTLAQAQSGLMWAMGDRDFDEPVGAVGAAFDQLGATLMAFGMTLGLLARERLGIGQEVHTSMLGAAVHIQSLNINMSLLRGRPYRRYQRKASHNVLTNNYRCSDGKWIMLAEPVSDRYWAEFCNVVGLTDIRDDARFANADARDKNRVDLIGRLDRLFATRSRDEWVKLFDDMNVGFANAPILDVGEAARHPQLEENEYVTDFDHPVLGKVNMAGLPIWFSQTPSRIRREAPEHGQHTEEILTDVLGYDWDQIARLREAAII